MEPSSAWSKHESNFVGKNSLRHSLPPDHYFANRCGGWVRRFFYLYIFCQLNNEFIQQKSRLIQSGVSLANRMSKKGLGPCARDNPSAPVFARHGDNAFSSTVIYIFFSECCMAQRFVVRAVALLSAKLSVSSTVINIDSTYLLDAHHREDRIHSLQRHVL